MKQKKLILVAIFLLSASMASAAITTGVVDFNTPAVNYPELDSMSNVAVVGGEGSWSSYPANKVMTYNFERAVRFNSCSVPRYLQRNIPGSARHCADHYA